MLLLSCNNPKESTSSDATTGDSALNNNRNDVIPGEGNNDPGLEDKGGNNFTSLHDLFRDLPMPTSLIAKEDEFSYLGTFYLNEDGIGEAVFESSGYKIVVNSVDINDFSMTVNFSLTDTGNEVKDATGGITRFSFEITLDELITEYQTAENRLRMEVQVIEVTE